ncbi:hypothetical protein BDV96DRAFT_591596 [Lophiotrema nucula]|uniref:DUF6924 domain-containing protein n=1 Tax=Lophiotrema nucula TaxID=690887 RepID=A0A6A5YGL9_9PLEO|nr:hypothetical protein BDV96DRAFT_591596 [Lophiotrema nucula]
MAVDLTLPESSSPAIDAYKDMPDDLLPFALFVHVRLSGDDELARVEEACNSQIGGTNTIQRVPGLDFSGQPLRAALAEHLNKLATRRFDPFYFVAVVDEDWKEVGLVIVTMDDGSDEDVCHIGQLRVPVEEVGLVLVNLQLANMDWSELEEQYEVPAGGHGDDDNDSDDDGSDSGGDEGGDQHRPDQTSPTAKHEDSMRTSHSWTDVSEYSDGASDKPPNVGYWIGLYAIPGIDFEAVMRALHPSWGPLVPFPELICRPEGRVPAESQAKAVVHAKRLHPLRCRNNLHLHRGMFLIIDRPSYEEDGILLVKADWDEKALESQKTMADVELAALGQAAETDTQRLPFSNATTITIFNEIKAGYRPWKHTHKTFLAYAGPQTRYPSVYLAAVDKSFKRRKSGAERFLGRNVQFTLTADGDVVTETGTGFQTALDQHAGFVHEARFCATLCPEYFVYCDKELAAKDTNESVVLVKVDWEASWSMMECKAGDAYQELCDVVDGNKDWQHRS